MGEGLITFIIVIAAIFLVFKILGWSIKIFFKLLINALIGGVMLFIFNYVFAGILNLSAFSIEINWITALVTGIFGIPGVIVLLIIGLI